MKYTVEQDLRDFQPWSGARDWHAQAIENGTIDDVQAFIEDFYESTGVIPTETDINDLLWFDEEVHHIIENKSLLQRMDELANGKFSAEALEKISEELDETSSDIEIERELDAHNEYPTIQEACKDKDCESEEELNDYYIVDKLKNSVLLS